MTFDKRKSKYYSYVFIGKGIEGADESGYTYRWNSQHPDLEPTLVFKTKRSYYCAYCREEALPIQSNISRYKDYSVTGRTCTCDAAEAEKEYQKEKEKLQHQYYQELTALQDSFTPKLLIDAVENLKIQHTDELRYATFHSNSSYFTETEH